MELRENADDPIRPEIEAVEYATDRLLLRLERSVADVIFETSPGWTGSSTPSPTWDDDTSDPIGDILDAKETFVSTVGREPNVAVCGYEVFRDLKDHPDILDRIKYTERGIVTVDLLSSMFDLDRLLVGTAIYNTAADEATVSMSYIWGKHFWLGYVPATPGLMAPAAGYVFTWKDRKVERFREDQEHQDIFTCSQSWAVEKTSADAGYLLKSAVA